MKGGSHIKIALAKTLRSQFIISGILTLIEAILVLIQAVLIHILPPFYRGGTSNNINKINTNNIVPELTKSLNNLFDANLLKIFLEFTN